jgi:hypothetical protein
MEQKNPVSMVAKKRAAREYVEKRKMRGRCVHCGFSDTRALDWHHDERMVEIYGPKRAAISAMVQGGDDIGKIRSELRKCVLLCANCHRIHHAKGKR